MKRRSHFAAHAVEIALLILLIAAVAFGFGVTMRSKNVLKDVAMSAATQAAKSSNPACNPPPGKATMAICAPTQAYAVADLLAKDAGDPETITSPIGVDVSNNNGCSTTWMATSWIRFAYFKASESTRYTDTCVRGNVAAAKARKLPFGLYDFLRPGYSSATAEALYFVGVVKSVGGSELPPVADVEVSDGESETYVRAYVATWVAVVKQDLKVTPDIYTAEGFWNGGVGGSSDGAGLWAADWATTPILADSWSRYEFWQYGSEGFGPAPHYGDWDMDTYNGTVAQLDARAGLVTAPKPKPKPTSTVTATIATGPVAPPAPAPSAKAKCFGKGSTPNSKTCKTVIARLKWLASRRVFWQHEFNRCIRYADGIGCTRAYRWFEIRGSQASKLRKKFS